MNLKKISLLKAIIPFPAGFAKEAFQEIESILQNLLLKKNHQPKLVLGKSTLCVENVHLDTIFEILLRSSLATDVRLVLGEGRVVSKSNLKALCDKIPWESYLNTSLPIKFKVDSIASELYHEGAMKEVVQSSVLSTFLKASPKAFEDIEDDSLSKNLVNHLYFEILKNKLTISLSLAGCDLYKRNMKKNFAASAPLREDYAFVCLEKGEQFLKKNLPQSVVSTLFVPFGGTGTFVFEYIRALFLFSNNFFNRKFSFEETSIYKEKTINFLNKKMLSLSEEKTIQLRKIIYSDIFSKTEEIFKENFQSLLQKIKFKSEKITTVLETVSLTSDVSDFFKMDARNFSKQFIEGETVLMPLNPPYGLRLNSKADSLKVYQKIIVKLDEISESLRLRNVSLCYFLLCPSEETWSLAVGHWKNKKTDTFHFTQGGLHIRVLVVMA